MASYARHTCGKCGKPVVNRKGMEWSHVNRAIEHPVKKIKIEKWEEAA